MKIKYLLGLIVLTFLLSQTSALSRTFEYNDTYRNNTLKAFACDQSTDSLPGINEFPACVSLANITDSNLINSSDNNYYNTNTGVSTSNSYILYQINLSSLTNSKYGISSVNITWTGFIDIFASFGNATFWIYNNSAKNYQYFGSSRQNTVYTLSKFINSTDFINNTLFLHFLVFDLAGTTNLKMSADYINFNVSYILPANPPLLFTANNSNFTSNFTLKWSNSTGGNSLSTLFYHMLITNNSGFKVYENTTINETVTPTNVTIFNFIDGSYFWKVESNTSQGLLSGFNETFKFLIDSTPPSLNIIHPDVDESFSYNQTIPINYSVFDNGVGLGTCYYQIDGLSLVNLPNCFNATFNTTNGIHTINISVNDSLNNMRSLVNTFQVNLNAPSINLNYPINNTWFNRRLNINVNWTADTQNAISVCQIYNDFNGTYANNKTKASTNHVMDSWSYNFSSDNTFRWNIFCNDTNTIGAFALSNISFNIDTVYPLVNITSISTTSGSQTVRFNSSYNELNCNSSFYSVYNLSNGIDNNLNNISLSCQNMNSTFTVSDYSTYRLQIYVSDKAGNYNLTNQNFTTSPTVVVLNVGGGGGGGGETTIPVIGLKSINVSYSELDREILYASINNYCSNKIRNENLAIVDYSDICVLTVTDLNAISLVVKNFNVNIDLNNLILFYNEYKTEQIFQGYATQDQINNFQLFTSILGLTNLLTLTPGSLDKPVLITGNTTISYVISSNKPLKSCEIITNTPDLTCTITNTTVKVIYAIKDANFLSRIFSGTVAVTTDATNDKIEQKKLNVVFRVYNLNYEFYGLPVWIALIVGLIVLIYLAYLYRKRLKLIKLNNYLK